MSENKCAKAVMLAAIAATTLVGTAQFNPEVALSPALKSAAPLSDLNSAAPDLVANVNIDVGNDHVHVNPSIQENGFDV